MGMMREAAQRYLLLRRSLGYELDEPGRLLLDFAEHLDGQGVTRLTIDAVAAWATAPQGTTPYWHWLRLSAVRGFAIHLHAVDPVHQVPPADLLPRQYTRPTPYLFSDDEVTALIAAAGRMRHKPAALTYQTLIGLLAVTGMRPGEAYRLDRDHFDAQNATLTVVRSKYGKTRQLFLHSSTVTALQESGVVADGDVGAGAVVAAGVLGDHRDQQRRSVCPLWAELEYDASGHDPAQLQIGRAVEPHRHPHRPLLVQSHHRRDLHCLRLGQRYRTWRPALGDVGVDHRPGAVPVGPRQRSGHGQVTAVGGALVDGAIEAGHTVDGDIHGIVGAGGARTGGVQRHRGHRVTVAVIDAHRLPVRVGVGSPNGPSRQGEVEDEVVGRQQLGRCAGR